MDGFFTPSPLLIALILLKTTGFMTLLLCLALIRAATARGPSRLAALLAALLALAGLWAQHGPAMMGVTFGPWVALAQSYKSGLAGFGPLALASAALIASALLRGRRFWGIDLAHGALILGTLALWGMTL